MKRTFDSKLWKSGHSLVTVIPNHIAKRFKLKEGDFVELIINQKEDKNGKD